MQIVFLDRFRVPHQTPLDTHQPEIGLGWLRHPKWPTTAANYIEDGQLVCSHSNRPIVCVPRDEPIDPELTAVFRMDPATTSPFGHFGLFACTSPTEAESYGITYENGAFRLWVLKKNQWGNLQKTILSQVTPVKSRGVGYYEFRLAIGGGENTLTAQISYVGDLTPRYLLNSGRWVGSSRRPTMTSTDSSLDVKAFGLWQTRSYLNQPLTANPTEFQLNSTE